MRIKTLTESLREEFESSYPELDLSVGNYNIYNSNETLRLWTAFMRGALKMDDYLTEREKRLKR